jgi:hypothetical protein
MDDVTAVSILVSASHMSDTTQQISIKFCNRVLYQTLSDEFHSERCLMLLDDASRRRDKVLNVILLNSVHDPRLLCTRTKCEISG